MGTSTGGFGAGDVPLGSTEPDAEIDSEGNARRRIGSSFADAGAVPAASTAGTTEEGAMMDRTPRQVFDNPATGEHVVLLTDPREHPQQVLVSHLFVSPGGRVAAPHFHPTIEERFLVL